MRPRHLHILLHSLGLNEDGTGRAYRNHFCTGPESDDYRNCTELVELGFMRKRAPSEMTGGDWLFTVTDDGKMAALASVPPPKPISRGRKRYLAFLRDDCGMTFIEWLKAGGGVEA